MNLTYHNYHTLKRGQVLWLSLLLCLGIPIGSQAQSSYTLEQCISYALENNKNIANARIDEYMAHEDVNEVISTGLPQINGSGEIRNNFQLPVFVLPAGGTPENPEFQEVSFGLPWDAVAQISASQLLLDGVFFLGLKASRTFEELSRKNTQRTKEETAYQVSRAYYTALISMEQVKLIQANLNRVKKLHEDTQALYESGFAEKIDAERLEINYTNLELELNTIENLAKNSLDLLKFQMGMPIQESLSLDTDIQTLLAAPPTLELSKTYAIEDKIEFDILETQRKLQLYNKKRFQMGYLPALSAFANYSWNWQWQPETSTNFDFTVGLVGLRLNVPIFDGLLKRSQIQRVNLEIQKIDNQMDLFTQNTDLAVTQASRQLESSYSNLETYRKNRELAQKVFDISTIKYKEGVGSSLELNDADSELKQTEVNYLRALFEYLVSQIDLDKAKGTFSKYH